MIRRMPVVNTYLNFILISIFSFLIWITLPIYTQISLTSRRIETAYSIKNRGQINFAKHYSLHRSVQKKTRYPEATSSPYILNSPNACRRLGKVSCLILVYSKVTYWRVRLVLRKTWLNATKYKPENVVIIFLLGTVDNPDTQEIIKNESLKYKDVVQGDFVDSYRNLTNKGVMGYRWVTENCKNAEIVVKIDDDAYINMFKLFKEFSYLKEQRKFIFCNKVDSDNMPIERARGNKWYVHADYFRGFDNYPHTYCSGVVVFLSTDIIPAMYHAAISTPFFWVDDFYLFGMLPSKIPGVHYEDISANFSFSYRGSLKCIKDKGTKCQFLVMMSKYIKITEVWNAVIQKWFK